MKHLTADELARLKALNRQADGIVEEISAAKTSTERVSAKARYDAVVDDIDELVGPDWDGEEE